MDDRICGLQGPPHYYQSLPRLRIYCVNHGSKHAATWITVAAEAGTVSFDKLPAIERAVSSYTNRSRPVAARVKTTPQTMMETICQVMTLRLEAPNPTIAAEVIWDGRTVCPIRLTTATP